MTKLKKIGRLLYRWWMKFARVLAIINTTLLLSLVYVLLIGPFSLVARLFGKDLLHHRIRNSESFWKPKEKVPHTPEHSRHQF